MCAIPRPGFDLVYPVCCCVFFFTVLPLRFLPLLGLAWLAFEPARSIQHTLYAPLRMLQRKIECEKEGITSRSNQSESSTVKWVEKKSFTIPPHWHIEQQVIIYLFVFFRLATESRRRVRHFSKVMKDQITHDRRAKKKGMQSISSLPPLSDWKYTRRPKSIIPSVASNKFGQGERRKRRGVNSLTGRNLIFWTRARLWNGGGGGRVSTQLNEEEVVGVVFGGDIRRAALHQCRNKGAFDIRKIIANMKELDMMADVTRSSLAESYSRRRRRR